MKKGKGNFHDASKSKLNSEADLQQSKLEQGSRIKRKKPDRLSDRYDHVKNYTNENFIELLENVRGLAISSKKTLNENLVNFNKK